jgi:alpha-glucosidase (family GH31 glycosyl hydrolase)
VDYSNPLAAELSRRWWAHRLGIGVAGSMVDFGDRTPEGALFYDKRRGDEMHNAYSYDYHRTVNKIFSERRGDDFILFGRAAAPGAQQWAGQFAGDHPANFTGLQGVLTGALNLCACGFSTWGSDLGGFLGWPEPGVYMRWTEFGCFSPLMRCHGRTPREPWEFGDAAVVNYKYYAWVRENLLDYIYAAARRAHETGAPMMQGMALAFPEARSLAAVDDQYMFGPDLLVAPVVTDGTSREIAFPPGRWSSLWDGQAVNGPGTIQYAAPLNIIPVFVHEGAAIPLRLNPQLELGQSLKQGVVHALLVGPPPRQNSNLSGRGEDISIALSSNGYSIEYPVGIEPDYFLLDAQDVTEVRVDGHPVAGWKTNIVSGRIAVRVKSLHPAAGNRREVDIDVAHH